MARSRLEKLQMHLAAHCCDALLIDNPVDLFYLTGLTLSVGRLVVLASHCVLFVDGRYIDMAKKISPCETLLREDKAINALLTSAMSVGFDSAFLSFEAVQSLKKNVAGKTWVAMPRPLDDLRICKEPGEIEQLRKAADLTWQGYRHVVSLLKEGVSEEALAFAFELFCRRHGASRLSFEPIIAFGENSAYPHYRAGKALLREGQNILIDVGAVVGGYAGDLTRVAFFGSPNPQLKRDYALLQTVQRMAMDQIRPGVAIGSIEQLVRDALRKEGCEELFKHGLGHGVGLEVHEAPSLKPGSAQAQKPFRPGMVFTIEPGLYRPGVGGVRYEDTCLCTENGVEILGIRS